MILDIIKKNGWHEGRKIDRISVINILTSEGYPILENVINFLEEYGNLLVLFENKRNGLKDDTIDFNFQKAMEIEVVERVDEYKIRIQKELCIIGTAYREYMILLMSNDGCVYGAYDDYLCYISDSGLKAIEAIVMDYDFSEIG